MNMQDDADGIIRQCGSADTADILTIINAAAEAYRNVIPADRWHDPYMSAEERASEPADGVVFSGYVIGSHLAGVGQPL